MRNLKKFLALVLAFMMAMSLMVTANAVTENVEFSDTNTVIDEFRDDVIVLSGMGVIKGHGDTGTFAPKGEVTRAQMAAIVYRLATGDASDARSDLYKEYHSFSDVKSTAWYAGYVGYCADAGYIQGYPDGTFNPDGKVTGYQALAMILRAMGYNEPGHNFTGSTWKAETGATATQRGMLATINKTVYANTLNNPANRELVAEMAFQGAIKAMVQYTNAFGYQTTGLNWTSGQITNDSVVSANQNPSLGYLYYGLTSVRSIIVGNQATGETATCLGVDTNTTSTSAGYKVDDYGNRIILEYEDETQAVLKEVHIRIAVDGTVDAKYDEIKAKLDEALENETATKYAYVKTSDATSATVVTGYYNSYEYSSYNMRFDFKTGLDQFAHEAIVWFDGRTGNTYKTYALLDKNTSDTPFFADDNTHVGVTAADQPGVTGSRTSVYWSDRFSRIGTLGATADSNLSPISTYRKVVNPSGIVYIALSAEVAEVYEKNTTSATPFLILGTDDPNESSFGITDEHQIRLANLTPDTKDAQKEVGALVTAWEIVGTRKFALDTCDNLSDIPVDDPDDNGATPWMGDVKYQLDPMTTKTVTVSSLLYSTDPAKIDEVENPVIKVFTTDGDELKLSGITLGDRVAEGATSEIITEALPIVTKEAQADVAWNIDLKAGITYTAYIDIVGRVISMVPASGYKFLYGTYADYVIGGKGTGTIEYNMVGVDWDGKIQADNTIKSLTITGLKDDGTLEADAAITNISNIEGKIAPINGTVYDLITTTKKDQGVLTTAVGNEIRDGWDTGYMYNATTGDLAEWTAPKKADGEDPWEITAQDAANGFKEITNNGVVYLLTKDTNFVIVSGTGTATLTVEPAKGLTGLLAGATSAEISYAANNEDASWNEVIFKTDADVYGTAVTTQNGVITDVIMSVENLTRWNTQTLYLDYDQESGGTGMILPGAPATVEQYDLWLNGQKVSVYVDTDLGDGDKVALTDADGTDSLFFTLAKAYEVNGTPVYKAVKAKDVTDPTGGNDGIGNTIGAGFSAQETTYTYVTVTNLHTGLFDDGTTQLVLNMDNVTVCDVQWKVSQATTGNAKADLGRSEITSVRELNNAVSVGKLNTDQEYEISVAVVYNTSNASAVAVYVLDVATA